MLPFVVRLLVVTVISVLLLMTLHAALKLVGPAGVGKTQSCLMLSVMATLTKEQGGLNGGVIYIDTEATFSPSRLATIAESRYPGQAVTTIPFALNACNTELCSCFCCVVGNLQRFSILLMQSNPFWLGFWCITRRRLRSFCNGNDAQGHCLMIWT